MRDVRIYFCSSSRFQLKLSFSVVCINCCFYNFFAIFFQFSIEIIDQGLILWSQLNGCQNLGEHLFSWRLGWFALFLAMVGLVSRVFERILHKFLADVSGLYKRLRVRLWSIIMYCFAWFLVDVLLFKFWSEFIPKMKIIPFLLLLM